MAELTHVFRAADSAAAAPACRRNMGGETALYLAPTYKGAPTGVLNALHYAMTGSDSLLPR